jgi:hypothetical protein
MTRVAYCTRQQVQDALAQADTFRSNTRIDAAIRTAGDQVDSATHRRFYPTTCTRYPTIRDVTGSLLWLDTDFLEMISVSSFVVDGVTYTEGTDFFLRPDDGPPYTSLKLIDQSNAAFSSLDRAMALTGEQGASNTTRVAGALNGSISSSVTTVAVTDSSLIGVGDLLTVGSERLDVTGQTYSSTGVALAGNLTASAGERTVSVDAGALLHEGERIRIGSERMFIESINGDTLTVRRAELGSQLATHSTSDAVHAARTLTVVRGVTGTTAASHSDAATITANDPPALAKEASLAYSLVNLEQSRAAYGRVVGSGDNAREASGRGLAQIVDELINAHGRLRLGSA